MMENTFSKEITVLPSLMDDRGLMSLPAFFSLFMDIATEHANKLGIGADFMSSRGLFWLTVRTKVELYRRPRLGERVTVTTWPEAPARLRCNRSYTVSQNGETLAVGKTEWALMNVKTGELNPTDGVFPPIDWRQDTALETGFRRVKGPFAGETAAYTVRSTDVDFGGHMNNAAYVRALIGTFSTRELAAMDVKSMDVAFRAPCFEGDTLLFRRNETEEGTEVEASRDGKPVFLAWLG